MPKLRKDDVADIDVELLDEADYNDEEYESYGGRIPPPGTELTGYLKRLWWCRTQEKADGTGLDPMIKALWIADSNDGDLEEYNGLPVFENAVLTPAAKFRWAPFLAAFGITIKAIKTSTYVEDEDDERMGGAPIERIGNFRPGEDHDEAWSRIITEDHWYNDVKSARAKRWLPWEDGEEPEDEEPEDVEDVEDEEPEDEEYDEEPEDEEEEPEDEPAPARGRRAQSAPRGSRTASKAPAARASSRARTAPARGSTGSRTAGRRTANDGTRSGTAGRRSTSAPARGRGAAKKRDDPPF